MPDASERGVAEKGPLLVPLVVPDASVVPDDVADTRNVNWSAALTRAPVMVFRNLMDAKRTANIAPCRPPAVILAVTVVGLFEPTIYPPTVPGTPVWVKVDVPVPVIVG